MSKVLEALSKKANKTLQNIQVKLKVMLTEKSLYSSFNILNFDALVECCESSLVLHSICSVVVRT